MYKNSESKINHVRYVSTYDVIQQPIVFILCFCQFWMDILFLVTSPQCPVFTSCPWCPSVSHGTKSKFFCTPYLINSFRQWDPKHALQAYYEPWLTVRWNEEQGWQENPPEIADLNEFDCYTVYERSRTPRYERVHTLLHQGYFKVFHPSSFPLNILISILLLSLLTSAYLCGHPFNITQMHKHTHLHRKKTWHTWKYLTCLSR